MDPPTHPLNMSASIQSAKMTIFLAHPPSSYAEVINGWSIGCLLSPSLCVSCKLMRVKNVPFCYLLIQKIFHNWYLMGPQSYANPLMTLKIRVWLILQDPLNERVAEDDISNPHDFTSCPSLFFMIYIQPSFFLIYGRHFVVVYYGKTPPRLVKFMFSKEATKIWENLPCFLWQYNNVKGKLADLKII